jgi:diguanylate cyclase (GGDEF)-like protein/PAS domain S-box-containing protein
VPDFHIVLVQDITARKEAEEKSLLQSAALETAANAIAITDRNGALQWVNLAWVVLTGYSKEEAIGQNARIVKSDKHDVSFYKQMWDTILAGKVWHGEVVNRRKDGSLYFEEETITPVLDQQGNVMNFIAIKLDITERKQKEEELRHTKEKLEAANLELQLAFEHEQHLAHTDGLTGVNNRRYLFELAGHEFDVAMRYQQPLSVIMFDLDHFKQINDTFGHSIGDQMLKDVIRTAHTQLRDVDLIGRYGGEEFVVILPVTSAQQAFLLAERIRSNVATLRVETKKSPAAVTLSIGIAEIIHAPQDVSVENVIHRADEAMYAAKKAGRNRTVIFDMK